MWRWMQTLLVNGALLLGAALTLFPLLWMLSVSLMPAMDSTQIPPPLLPDSPTLEHYKVLFERLKLGRYVLNSVGVALAVTALSLLLNSMAGYAFAKLRFPGREWIFQALVASMVLPAQIAMLPLFLMLKQFGLVNSYGGLIVPGMASIFGIFLIRQYALSIPNSLLDAARVDGAGEFRIYWSVVLPLLKPILVTLAIFTFLGCWNDFMWPLILLADQDLYTLPVALANLMGEHAQDTEMMMAGSVLTIAPVLLMFLLLQKYYIDGLMLGGVKE
ncbi:carbohydrate ABC transporter permease [Methylogaea oryzae]|uniref:Sugar ABC transporter permease n=1 Tax=Methylogaea oryzae TaxID=1295382 RepID=A0A8D4VPL4_9GAMM|nr:carbohydrate ABC transporter permease [Methylogaea oryzae]BBL71034.1 sugar ABC transporter permease [Methylogaea oryzae]